MRGQLLGVDGRTGEGQVAGDDGRRYVFGRDDWAHRGEPAVGALVDFEADGKRALCLFPVPMASPVQAVATAQPRAADALPEVVSDRNKYVAALLAFLFSGLGIHRFYLGRMGSGIAMLVLSITVVGLAISVPWAFVDMLRYLVMSDRDFARRYARLVR